MKNINLVVMGKTGAGKSTLINALLGENVAPTGYGGAVTKENKLYEKNVRLSDSEDAIIKIYDTVGLEVDRQITEYAITRISEHIESVIKNSERSDISAVWFCVNYNSNRFEKYELELIRKLSVENAIPFVVVVTQCYDNSVGELERQIRNVGDIPIKRVLAEDYQSRIGTFESYGIKELLDYTINEYAKLRVVLAETGLNELCEKLVSWKENLERQGRICIEKYTNKATKAGILPVGCIPFVHGICIKMVKELNAIFSIKCNDDKVADFFVGAFVTPLMTIPLLSAATANAYVSSMGEGYLETLLKVIEKNANIDIEDSKKVVNMLKQELNTKNT